MKKTLVLFVGTAIILGAQTAKITGVVKDTGGVAVEGAVVNADLRSSAQPISAKDVTLATLLPVAANALSGKNGEFEIDGLQAGSYSICAEKVAGEILNSCLWPVSQLASIAVPAGGTVSGVSVVAQKGVTVLVRVADANSLLGKHPSADDLLIGTRNGTSSFIPARVVRQDSSGRTMALIVPRGAALNISVSSGALSLADPSGKAITATAIALPLTAPLISPAAARSDLSSAAPDLTIQVTGIKAVP